MEQKRVYFELWIDPETREQAWHATLSHETQEKLEFTNPLELIRYLAYVTKTEKPTKGLR